MLRIPGAISPAKPLVAAIAIGFITTAHADGISIGLSNGDLDIAIAEPNCASYTVDATPATDTPETLTFDEAVALFSSECSAPSASAAITIADSLAGQTLSETTAAIFLDSNRQLSISGNAENPPVLIVESYSSPSMFNLSEGSKLALQNLKLAGSYSQNTEAASESNAIRVFNSTLELNKVVAEDFYVSGAGSVVDAWYSTVTITDSVFDGNIASNASGGAISTFDTALTITDSVFTNNRANPSANSVASGGGAIAANGGSSEYTNSSLTISGSEFTGNQAKGQGGALLIDSDNPVTISDSVFDNNSVTGVFNGAMDTPAIGGAISMERVDANLSGNTFINNHATGQNIGADAFGAALFIGNTVFPEQQTGGVITISDSTFQGNHAASAASQSQGGGIYISNSASHSATVSVVRSTLNQNSAKEGGALAHEGNTGTLSIINSTISGNSATTSAAGVYLSSPTTHNISIAHSTIVDNQVSGAGTVGSGIFSANGSGNGVAIHDTVVANNSGGAGNVCATGEGTLEFDHSLIADAGNQTGCLTISTGTGSLTGSNESPLDAKLDPLADNGGPTQTHYPQSDSPLVDAGNLSIIGEPATDQRGSTRIITRIDIGAVESGNLPPELVDSIGDVSLSVNSQLNINAGAAFVDPESGTLVFSLEGAPTGISIDPDTGIISGTLTETGSFAMSITATDADGLSTTVNVDVTVKKAGGTSANNGSGGGGGGALSLMMLALLGLLGKRR